MPAGTVLWTGSRDLRCVLVPYFERWQLRLMRGERVIRTEVFVDNADATRASEEWRHRFAASEPANG